MTYERIMGLGSNGATMFESGPILPEPEVDKTGKSVMFLPPAVPRPGSARSVEKTPKTTTSGEGVVSTVNLIPIVMAEEITPNGYIDTGDDPRLAPATWMQAYIGLAFGEDSTVYQNGLALNPPFRWVPINVMWGFKGTKSKLERLNRIAGGSYDPVESAASNTEKNRLRISKAEFKDWWYRCHSPSAAMWDCFRRFTSLNPEYVPRNLFDYFDQYEYPKLPENRTCEGSALARLFLFGGVTPGIQTQQDLIDYQSLINSQRAARNAQALADAARQNADIWQQEAAQRQNESINWQSEAERLEQQSSQLAQDLLDKQSELDQVIATGQGTATQVSELTDQIAEVRRQLDAAESARLEAEVRAETAAAESIVAQEQVIVSIDVAEEADVAVAEAEALIPFHIRYKWPLIIGAAALLSGGIFWLVTRDWGSEALPVPEGPASPSGL